MTAEAIEQARHAAAAIEAARANVTAEKDKLRALERQKAEEADERVRLREVEDGDAAKRLLDGDEAAPEKPRRRSRLSKLDENAPVLTAAIKLQENRIAAAQAAIQPLMGPLVAAMLHVIADVQSGALDDIRECLGKLAGSAARLIAADQIMAATIGGTGFPIPRGAPLPVNGTHILGGFLKAIPDTLRPDALDTTELAGAARAISQPILEQMKGNQNV